MKLQISDILRFKPFKSKDIANTMKSLKNDCGDELGAHNDKLTALSMVSTALFVLDEYKCQDLFDTIANRGIKSVKKEIDTILSEEIYARAQSN